MSETIARSLRRIPASQSILATDRARELIRSGRDVISLTAGEPDFDTPNHVKDAAIAAIRRGETKYPPVDGIVALKQAVSDKFARENRIHYAIEQVSIANGAKQVIFNAFLATLDAGDEVLIPAPYWVSYPAIAQFAGADVKFIETTAAANFKIEPDELRRSITSRTKWLILNSPNNPAGSCYRAEELEALAEVVLENPHLMVLSDDIYEHLTYDGNRFATLAEVAPELAHRILTVNGVSKAYAMTGWRIGYAGGPKWLIAAMRKLQSQSTGGANSIAQHAAVAALNGDQSLREEWRRIFQQRRDLVCRELCAIPGLQVDKPEGAFYVFPSCEAFIESCSTPGGARISSDLDFANYLVEEAGVAGVHGAAYGASPFIRFSFATSEDLLLEACKRVREACAALTA